MSSLSSLPRSVMATPSLYAASLMERMEVMFWQEVAQYRTGDYLDFKGKFSGAYDVEVDQEGVMNEQWRTRMCEWAYQLVDHFDFPRHIVSTTMNFLDRYLEKYFTAINPDKIPRINKKQFQLVTMCCLYVAMKLKGTSKIPIQYMVQLSRGTVKEADLVDMETELLSTLAWRVNPPTSYDFLKHYLQLLQPAATLAAEGAADKSLRLTALEDMAFFLVELSVLDYFFVNFRPSTIAVAALLNAMDEDLHQTSANPFLRTNTLFHGYEALVLPGEEDTVYLCRQRLGSLYRNAEIPVDSAATVSLEDTNKMDRITSPVSVITANTMNQYGNL